MTEQQWLKIYRDTVHPLYGYMVRRTAGNRELTEDIVQESYLRALNTWRRKPLPESPLAWLKRVARNLLIDYLRQNKRNRQIDREAGPNTENTSSENDVKSLEIFMAISSLGQKKARILEAFYYEGMSIKEIAETMSLSERAVEGLLRRARHSLKSLLPEFNSKGGKHE